MNATHGPERPPLRVRIAQAMAAHPRLGSLYSDHPDSYLTPHKGTTADYVTEADAVLAVVEAEIDRVARERDVEITQLTAEVERLKSMYELAERQYAEQTGELKTDRDRYKAAHESTQQGLIRMEVQRDEAHTELGTIRGELADFAQESVPSHVSTLQAVRWLIAEHDEQVKHNEEVSEEVGEENRALCDERDRLREGLRGMARRVGEFRQALKFADAHVPQWERIISERQKEIELLRMRCHEVGVRATEEFDARMSLQAQYDQAVEDWGRNDEQMLAENQRLADQLAAAAALVAEFRQSAEQAVATFGEDGQHDDECDSPAECHASAQHFTWKLAASSLEKALGPVSESVPATPRKQWGIRFFDGSVRLQSGETPAREFAAHWEDAEVVSRPVADWVADPLRASAPSEIQVNSKLKQNLDDAVLFAVAQDRVRRDKGERHTVEDVARELEGLDDGRPSGSEAGVPYPFNVERDRNGRLWTERDGELWLFDPATPLVLAGPPIARAQVENLAGPLVAEVLSCTEREQP